VFTDRRLKVEHMTDDEVVVPEGHKVVVFRPAAKPFLARAQSGLWILNFGDGSDCDRALDAIDEFVARADKQSVIWILQADFFKSLRDLDGFLERVRTVVTRSRGTVGHCAVFATEASRRTDVMQAFGQLGLGVHYSAPDGACFVEVHRPDGIVVGMPGRAFDSGAL
jgi:hypothetical protein